MLTDYYQKKQRKLSQKAPERYQNLSEEKKDKKCQYACEQYRNLSIEETEKNHQYGRDRYKSLLENEKQMLVEYKTNWSKMLSIGVFLKFYCVSGYSTK